MNAWDRRSETYTSKTGCATSASDKSSSEEKKQSAASTSNSDGKPLATKTDEAERKGPWAEKEHSAFLDGLYQYGCNWKQIAAHVHSRNTGEVEHYFHSFQKEEPFLFRLRKMLGDKSLDHALAWHPTSGRSFVVFNRACIKVAIPLYFGAYFRDMSHFQRELYAYGFRQDLSSSTFEASVWFHPQFLRDPSLELKEQASKSKCCNYEFCNKTNDLRKCTGCFLVHYCSLPCQQSDWNAHMWVCGKVTSGNDKPSGTVASTPNKMRVTTKAIPEKANQSKATASPTTETQKPSKELVNTDKGKSSSEELKGQALQSRVCNNSLCKNTEKLMLCSGCRNVDYCSLVCQQADWRFHMLVCGKEVSGNDKPRSTDTDTRTSNNTSDKNAQVIPNKLSQDKAKTSTTTETQKPLKDDYKTNTGKWSTIEHCLFLEGLERYGRSWQDIASHVKTRSTEQVSKHAWGFLKKTDCYWTTKEHRRFLEGLEQYGKGRWIEIASHVGTKSNEQVSFHAEEYFEEMSKIQILDDSEDSSSDYEESSQRKASVSAHSEPRKPFATNVGEWSAGEHDRFLQGYKQHGKSWKDVASHVKTRNREQVRKHGYCYLKKIDCYWTTEEHLWFLEGLDKYGRGHWGAIANHVGTKDNKQVAFHAKEYFKEKGVNGKPQKTADDSEEDSTATMEFINKPNHVLLTGDCGNTKRSRDEEDDPIENLKKIKANEPRRKNNNEQSFVTPEKDTLVEENMHDFMDSTNCLQSSQTTTDPQNRLEATYDRNNHEHEKLSPSFPAKENNDIRPVGHKSKKKATINTDVHDTSCPICLEKLNDPHIVPECCHRFCKGCIEEALEYRRECPICRGRVTSRRSLRRDEVFGKLLRLLDIERAKANTNSVLTIDEVDQLSNDAVAATECQKKVREKNETIHGNGALTIGNKNIQKLSNDAVATDHQTKDGKKNEKTDSTEMTQEACMQEKEQTQVQAEEEQIVRNVNIEVKAQGDAIEDQLKLENLETQLEEKSNRINTLENSSRTLSARCRAVSEQLREKNGRIQHLESRQKADKESLEHVTKAVESLETEVEEKDAEIHILEKFRTISDGNKLESMAAAVKDLQSQLQEKNERIKDLESRPSANEKSHGGVAALASSHLETQLEEKNSRIKFLENLVRTVSDEHKVESMAASEQLQGKNDRIELLEARLKVHEDKLQSVDKASEQLKTQLEEKNTEIRALGQVQALYDIKKLESVTASEQLEEKNVRIQHLETRLKANIDKLQQVRMASEQLETQLEEKNSRISTLENLVQTLHNKHKLETMAATSLLREKNDKIQHLESRQKEDEDKLQDVSKANEQLETELEEKNTKISTLENLVQTLTDLKKLESIDSAVNDLRSQLEDKNDRIQFLESRQKADEEKLQHYGKTSNHLQTQLEEQNTKIQTLENSVRTLSEIKKLEEMVAAVNDPQTQLQQKNDRIQFLESRQENVEERLRQMTEFVLCLSKKLTEGK
ncbi:hypothetical protein CTEN210_03587 [Chaetoceros tenuissimus]|uniref:RING-type E3 ubiquitin transferase n=1 Tax=Chaetoceros tenuissimus TaxID=426638 RepID=A0AAD3CJ83_9STRA|nr:hypothetical protein CTEN210_03587 [Chaetoceros tenuissimus]